MGGPRKKKIYPPQIEIIPSMSGNLPGENTII